MLTLLLAGFEDQGDFQVFVPYNLPSTVNYNSIMEFIRGAWGGGDLGWLVKGHPKSVPHNLSIYDEGGSVQLAH